MRNIKDDIAKNHFFEELTEKQREQIALCGKNIVFKAHQKIANEGDASHEFYLIRNGRILIETSVPSKPPLVCQTLGAGDILGWSWLVKPHKWAFDILAGEETQAICIDGACLRKKCEEDHELGYMLMKKFAVIMSQRLKHTRMQLMDVYGSHS